MNYTRHFECGCKVVVIGELTNAVINYCPKHKAAPDMYGALKEMLDNMTWSSRETFNDCGFGTHDVEYGEIAKSKLGSIYNALAKAEGK